MNAEVALKVSSNTIPEALVARLASSSPDSILSVDWRDQAIPHFFANYILPPVNGRPGHFEFLPQLYRSEHDSPCFTQAMLAISTAYICNVRGDRSLAAEARKYYGRALVALRAALSDRDELMKPTTLAAVMLLSRFEVSRDK
jgi:hypothetical protein